MPIQVKFKCPRDCDDCQIVDYENLDELLVQLSESGWPICRECGEDTTHEITSSDETSESISVQGLIDESPKPGIIDTSTFKKVDDPVVANNLLLGFIAGHLENLVTESYRANENARRRHDEWKETLISAGEIQAEAQKTGAKVIMIGICLMSTIISVVVSLLI